ncbi:folate-sensitive fragile site protein Fra10Ac1-domain-containing protein, partial [Crassisporium funariophilum]
YRYGGASASASKPVGITEFEILKASHKFLRDEDEKASSWDEKLAEKYYSSLYREFAVCDLKHYKSGNFSIRWRTEEEVLSGAGETTCGNTRCKHHFAPRFQDERESKPSLTTLELPFGYVEQGESKSALVKVVLCGKCVGKLMWKRRKEKEEVAETAEPNPQTAENPAALNVLEQDDCEDSRKKESSQEHADSSRRRRRSRSRSPRRSRE